MARQGLKARDDRQEPGPAAKAFMILSALAVAALLSYMAYQALTAPGSGLPEARVVATTPTPEGDVLVEVALRNVAVSGLREAVVEVDCQDPAPQVAFANVPAEGERRGFLLCPAGTQDPKASVASYTRA